MYDGFFKLNFRPDNADMRLTALGRQFNAVSDYRWEKFLTSKHSLDEATKILKGISFGLNKWCRLLPRIETKNKARGEKILILKSIAKS